MILLASGIEGFGGVFVVNRLILDAARAAALPITPVALRDAPGSVWMREWPGSSAAGGSYGRFTLGALAKHRHAGTAIFITHLGLAPVGRLLKMRTGARMLVFLHGVEAWRALPGRTRWGLAGCDMFVANSRFTLARFAEYNPAFAHVPARVCYLPARRLAAATSSEQRAGRPLRVLIVGALEGRGLVKGQRQLIALWPTISAEFPSAELWIVGGGPGRRSFEAQARACGVGASVRFTGTVSDAELDALYRAADVYAMPSRGEGFGLVFAEAMMRGLPCIASRDDAGSEVVVDGETGLVVDPSDEGAILHALRRLLSDAALRRRMGEAGRARAAELFSVERFNDTIVQILSEQAGG